MSVGAWRSHLVREVISQPPTGIVGLLQARLLMAMTDVQDRKPDHKSMFQDSPYITCGNMPLAKASNTAELRQASAKGVSPEWKDSTKLHSKGHGHRNHEERGEELGLIMPFSKIDTKKY